MKNLYIKIFLYFILISNVFAQGYIYNGVQFYNETKQYFKSPIKWQGKDFIILSSLVVSTYGLMQFDEEVKNLSKQHLER